MTPSPDTTWLRGDSARDWFFSRSPDAPHVWDMHLTAIAEAFDQTPEVTFRALIDPMTNKPSRLIIEIHRPVDDADAWEHAELAQMKLEELRREFAERFGRPDRQWEDVVIALVDPPRRDPLRAPLVDD